MDPKVLLRRAQAAEVADRKKPSPVPEELLLHPQMLLQQSELPEALKSLSPHVLDTVPREKLLRQCQFFTCPEWAAVPSIGGLHLECAREGVRMAPLKLDRYPFYLLGQSKTVCDFVLEHPSISQVHCALIFHSERKMFVVVDLSTNGVKVNGKRIEKNRPVALPVESVLEFGSSTRTYELKKAESKQKSGHAVERSVKTAQAPVVDAPEEISKSSASAAPGETAALVEPPKPQEGRVEEEQQNEKETGEKNNPPPAPLTRHFRHILLKHKDVRNPKSLAARNKGEPITRSEEDALRLAVRISNLHAVPPSSSAWDEEKFAEAAREYSECKSSKDGGDLGQVTQGDYGDEFDGGAFAVGPGQVSRPVRTELGVHLIFRCLE